MGQRPAELTPDASPWHRWGAELRRCRLARELSLEDLGQRIHVTRSYLSKLERGQRSAPLEIADACDKALDVAGTLKRAWSDAATASGSAAGRDSRPRVHVSNPDLDVSNSFEGLAIAGVTQESSEDEGISVPCRLQDGRVVFVTIPRRVFLSGAGLGALAAVGFPASATAHVSTTSTRARALVAAASGLTPVEHLRRLRRLLIDNDNMLGPRRVISTVHEQIKVVQALRGEALGSDRRQLMELQTQFAEFASWLHQDVGDFSQAGYWLDRALQWSHTVGDAELTAYVMARKSQLAGEALDLVDVVDLAEAAQGMARPGGRLAAVGKTYEAFGHALRGEAAASDRAFDHARAAVEDLAGDPSPWGVWLNVPYVEIHRAQAIEALGQHARAAEVFAGAIRLLPPGYHRDRGVYLAREAVSHAGAEAPEQAAAVGLQALCVAEDTGSGRILRELARLDNALQAWSDLPEVAEFRTSLDSVVFHEAGRPS